MASTILIHFGAPVLAALAGGAIGWWMRGRPSGKGNKRSASPQKQATAQILQSLHSAAETVRSCVEQHADCIQAIKSELDEASATEPLIITKLAESIIESNGLAQHQCNDIRKSLNTKRQEIRDCLANSDRLLFTFASLDRQKQAYRQVLTSLEVLAAELSNEIKGHGQRLQKISGGLENQREASANGVAGAVTQILDATAEVEQCMTTAEQRIATQAESIEMQAILTHADLLTSLPNRRAFIDELKRPSLQGRREPLATVILIDLDSFSQINREYGHQGGNLILRQVAAAIKKLARGRDMVARFRGDTFALLLQHTTLHDALPLAERIRSHLHDAQFSQGSRPLRITASVGIAQLRTDELRDAETNRAEQALLAAKKAGGNVCYRHDGESCFPVSSAFHAKLERAAAETLSLAALWRDSAADAKDGPTSNSLATENAESNLTG
ncbi:MAG TPA: GGDEF domain-containing protein, partial [Lacipirellulaceae bacterium]|nr:GGDEF domain-containing protein [Lacipirellulaceae bacterium]